MGAFTLPRELILDRQNKVRNRPVKELEALREKPQLLTNITLNNELKNTDIKSISCEVNVEIDLANSNAERFGLQLAATQMVNKLHYCILTCNLIDWFLIEAFLDSI